MDLSATAGAAGERQGDDQEDSRTGGRTVGEVGEGETSGWGRPSRRVSPFALLSYKGRYHSRWPQGRREESFFSSLFSVQPGKSCGGWEGGRGEGVGGMRCKGHQLDALIHGAWL